MANKELRILITPNVAAPYDQRMVKRLAEGFAAIGHHASALMSPISSAEVTAMCKNLPIDVVIQVNRTRDPNEPLPNHVRYVSWFQDVYPDTMNGFSDKLKSADLLYSLGDPTVLGFTGTMPCFLSTLFTGVCPETLDFNTDKIAQDLDFSLCGGLPGPVALVENHQNDTYYCIDNMIQSVPVLGRTALFWLIRRALGAKHLPVDYVPYATLRSMVQIAETWYRPLRGELDIHLLAEAMWQQAKLFGGTVIDTPKARTRRESWLARVLRPHVAHFNGRSDTTARLVRYLAQETAFHKRHISPVRQAISYFSHSYPRFMDRAALVEAATKVSPSLEVWGPGMSAYAFARPYFKGVLEEQNDLLTVYARSKLNLANNTHGLGMHSRNLECMAVGGFVFVHESPHDHTAGGMLTHFEAGEHFGFYTPENFQEEATRWLRDDTRRKAVGVKAKALIAERHTWRHRAQQIIEDLKR